MFSTLCAAEINFSCLITNVYRLEKLTKLLNTVATYDVLSLSQLDGMDVFSQRFNVLVTTLKKKPYDILEHRKADFDVDYDDFQRQLLDLNVRTSTHMFTKPFPCCVSVHTVLAPFCTNSNQKLPVWTWCAP